MIPESSKHTPFQNVSSKHGASNPYNSKKKKNLPI